MYDSIIAPPTKKKKKEKLSYGNTGHKLIKKQRDYK